jgi:hypothetical protein
MGPAAVVARDEHANLGIYVFAGQRRKGRAQRPKIEECAVAPHL